MACTRMYGITGEAENPGFIQFQEEKTQDTRLRILSE